MSTYTKTGLVLPGGGARGAYQVGVLKGIAECYQGQANPFPILTGASVGAINAAALASRAEDFQNAVAHLEGLWRSLRSQKVFRADLGALLDNGLKWLFALTFGGLRQGNPNSLLDNGPLRALLDREIDYHRIEEAIHAGALRAVAVTASSYSRGKAITFYEGAPDITDWQRARREGLRQRLSTDHIMGSVALPFIFPPQKISYEYFGDGSLRLTSPLSPAIHFGAERILVIGMRDDQPAPTPDANHPAPFPTLGTVGGSALDILFNDNLGEDIERTERVNNILEFLPTPVKGEAPLRQVHIMTIRPSADVRSLALQHVSEIPWALRLLLKGVGAWGQGWQLPSYLMFEPGFCGALIDLGHHDALQRRHELMTFLKGEVL